MNKSELISEVSLKSGLTKVDSENINDAERVIKESSNRISAHRA